ncbi:O-methylsterigmatocystin oxidoreductase [Trametes pubescens]|uniref:O-methylsterigmatocystin oxidoreductase n=1 Tax=Trametes pubescens TaxID=154538 RepID=A0A1M2VLZ1_TRAPU|nr:O-methylsterigmatocystin oxidoreductase [Trametes pubescens]
MIFWLGVILILVYVIFLRRRKPSLPFPPGPPGLPVIGNALDIPTTNIARRLHDLAAQYGKLVYFSVLGRSIVVLDSYDTACELLDKRSRNYSDRPDSVMAKLTTFSDSNLPLISYGPRWRQHRRIFHQTLQLPTVDTAYRPNLRQVTRELLLNLLEGPQAFSRHINHAFVASVLSIGYGINIPRDDIYYGKLLHDALETLETIVVPGKYPVEVFPALQYLPSWMPGAGFKKDIGVVRENVLNARHELYDKGKSLLDSEYAGDTMIAMMLRRAASLEGAAAVDEEEQCTGALIGTYLAGSDTTVASVRAFFLAMAMYPDVQRKAQGELDRVVGRTRLPDFEDRNNLPYVNAIVKELTRWNVVAPMGLPHAALEDDEYNGYFIPKGSIVMVNVWAISRDPTAYPDPETFNPDRFLKDGELYAGALDPYSYIFGFGRRYAVFIHGFLNVYSNLAYIRVCPGRHLADASLFLTCAAILHAFSISPPLDDNGKPVKLKARVETDRVIA